ncbi:MAG TPA: type II toxin-antitoxin system VapB family antitoxin [Hyphomicrobiaceae bacterium]|nr:type II toxin-antitoxin system VapB family antitoxin [Hyphomicrobiaceae bacterium]
MTLQLSAEIEGLVRRIAKRTGRAPDDVVREAIEAAARAAGVDKRLAVGPGEVMELARENSGRVAALPLLYPRTPDEIIGYDESGLPR